MPMGSLFPCNSPVSWTDVISVENLRQQPTNSGSRLEHSQYWQSASRNWVYTVGGPQTANKWPLAEVTKSGIPVSSYKIFARVQKSCILGQQMCSLRVAPFSLLTYSSLQSSIARGGGPLFRGSAILTAYNNLALLWVCNAIWWLKWSWVGQHQ